ncbi:glycosyltransferase family 2 protein [Dokdonia sp. Asnod1-B02]|uniref:glycosyltransferase family 2 protein n=1 Tax=Dokdonia sp. Asnod1-B02 TaxID=3160573 RepID=UPI00386797DC
MKNEFKVSIITPVYNAERFLRETSSFVVNQTYQNWEWLLVDDCSQDNSRNILKELASKDKRIKPVFLDINGGSGPARNIAIDQASGKYIAFLDSDDFWSLNKLERHVAFMQEHDASFSHTSYGFTNEEGNRIRDTYHVSRKPVTFKDLLKRTEISCLTAMYDQEKIGKYFMPDVRRKQDYALWLSILKDGYCSIPLDEELALYRQVKGSATNNKFKLIFKHYSFLRKYAQLSRLEAIKYSIHWGLNGLKKYYL